MPCYSPLSAYRCQDGSVSFSVHSGGYPLHLPCGQCVGCRLERSRQWAVRCMHEASCFDDNCFLTLTYDDDHIPSDRSLCYTDFQKFMKRLRFSFRGRQALPDGTRPIRFYMCGEYGENFGRPHYHACVFNFDFVDKKLWSTTKAGSRLYRSDSLEELWPFGFSSIGDVNFKSAAYVARYIMKKVNGRDAEDHYVNPETGEVLTPEFTRMSRRPGIGAFWFDKFSSDVYPHDYLVVNGKKVRPPRYYDKLYSRVDIDAFSEAHIDFIKYSRGLTADKHLDNNTPERLNVREHLAHIRLSKLKRSLT